LPDAIDWRRVLRLALAAAVVGALLVVLAVMATPSPEPNSGVGYSMVYANPTDRFEVLLNHADGQAYATLARDPTLSHPDYFAGHGEAAAPFLPRPVMPYLLWVLSVGHPGWLEVAFVLAEGLAAGLLVAAAAALLHGCGRSLEDRLALAVLALPSTLVALFLLGQDVLALGLVLLGIVAWCRARPAVTASIVLFTLAALTRETTLVLVAVVGVYGLVGRGWRRRDGWLAVPFLAYLAWSAWASTRYHLRTGRGLTYNLAAPFTGFVQAAGGWSWPARLFMAAIIGFCVLALVRPSRPLLGWMLAGFLAASTVAAERVWDAWASGARVIMPGAVLALLAMSLPGPIAAAVRGRASTPPSGRSGGRPGPTPAPRESAS